MNLGIIGCSEIAFRRFMPAVQHVSNVKVIAVAEEYDERKIDSFCSKYGLEGMNNITALLKRDDIEAVYIPQPPALHYKWAKEALKLGKHVLIEKPSTESLIKSKELVEIAKLNNLALHENYMFQYHSQIETILKMLNDKVIGDVRLFKASFGFPRRKANDFRYVKALGGGALLDAGGYTVKLATLLLGDSITVDAASLSSVEGYEVDMYGSAQLSNKNGTVCQISFGMDCSYKCMLEVWGSKGYLIADRVFTAPESFEPVVRVELSDGEKIYTLPSDNHFIHSIEQFLVETNDCKQRDLMYNDIVTQATLIDNIRKVAENNVR